ncbi:MAG: DUF5320 domain-containing protein [Deltaproteobacteria bacterium]|nr:DUF5320 domain-containing protein [Deltaproteobacteria bacterium]MBZ0219895.1 DUF5320 domain-containing protein [Deltaproteobacteria bacterium]
MHGYMHRIMRRRLLSGTHCPWCGIHRWPAEMDRESRKEEIEDLKEHIEHLREDLKVAEEDLKELEKGE